MKTNFTPGPWIYQQGHSPAFQGHVWSEETGKYIAVTHEDEGGHNAALIAAAPVMYEQLVKALEWLDALESGVSMPEMRRASIQAFLQEIRGTLNKVGS
jgi:hypothetical protein